jgi:hypothetical protein
MTFFRPSASVKIVIRAEEFNETSGLDNLLGPNYTDDNFGTDRQAQSPQSPSESREDSTGDRLARNQQRLTQLQGRRSGMDPDLYQSQLAELRAERTTIFRELANASTGDGETPPPAVVSGRPPDDRTVVGNIEPVSVQIERNGLSTAGTATIEMDYIDMPFDPRVIRNAHVEILVGVVPADDYEAGIENNEKRDDGSLLSVVGRADDGNLQGATRFVGLVDSWSTRFSEERDVISLECRDMSAYLRDIPLHSGLSIDLTLPIDEGIRDLLNRASAATRDTTVVWAGDGDPIVPADAMSSRRRGRRGRRQRRARRSNEDMSLWDHITDVVGSIGFIAIFRDYDVTIIEARTLFGSEGVQRMIYGRNIEVLEFTRRMQGVKVPTIEVRSYDADLGRIRWARYPVRRGERTSGIFGRDNPPRPLRANEVPPSGSNPEESIKVIRVSQITDPETLSRIARNYFEQVGRQEIEGSIDTREVSSYDVNPEAVDLLNMQAGDSIEVLLATGRQGEEQVEISPNTSLAQILAMGREQRKNYFISLGWSEDVAETFSALQEISGLQTVFRVQDVRINWNITDGVKVSLGFTNYVTVREDEVTS